ncbi:MAG: CbtA family protein, partial [Actinobacteria bacterium]|nr:CbtA family protein [Actinomycetota bacterium]
MSSSTTAVTSRAHPATESARLRATAWLRVALIAGLAAALVALVFDLLVAERVVDRAVALEAGTGHDHALGVPEPFSRAGQRGGLVAGELMLGLGFGLLVAGALTFLAPLVAAPRRLWLLVVGGFAWAVVALPNAVYPPLPPGVDSALPLGERQLLWLAAVAIGIGGFAGAALAWSRRRRWVAAAALACPLALAVMLLPDQRAAVTDGTLLAEFRAAAITSQVLFWAAFAGAGAFLLGGRRDHARPQSPQTGGARRRHAGRLRLAGGAVRERHRRAADRAVERVPRRGVSGRASRRLLHLPARGGRVGCGPARPVRLQPPLPCGRRVCRRRPPARARRRRPRGSPQPTRVLPRQRARLRALTPWLQRRRPHGRQRQQRDLDHRARGVRPRHPGARRPRLRRRRPVGARGAVRRLRGCARDVDGRGGDGGGRAGASQSSLRRQDPASPTSPPPPR